MTACVDLLLRNVRPRGGALCDIAIHAGKVAAIGVNLAFTGPEFNGDGCDVIPGLHDHHIHLFATAAQRTTIDLSRCIQESAIISTLRKGAEHTDGEWVRATGLIERDGYLPDRTVLDRWMPAQPLKIQDRTGALWLLNSHALAAIGPGPWPEGVECDAKGVPTGRIWRSDVWLRSRLRMPLPSLAHLSRELARLGVTAVTDAGASNGTAEAILIEDACQAGDLVQRVTLMGTEDLPSSHLFTRGPLKLLYDETALPDLSIVAARIHAARRQNRNVAAHCVTLGELIFFLAALEQAGGQRSGDRIEHGSLIPESLLPDISTAGLIVVTQPGFIRTRGDRYRATMHHDDLADLYRLGSLTRMSIPVLAGSDAPYGSFDPWQAMDAAITRTTETGEIIGHAEAIQRDLALRLFAADKPIRSGMPADLCLLARPLSAMGKSVITEPVMATIINGQLIWTA